MRTTRAPPSALRVPSLCASVLCTYTSLDLLLCSMGACCADISTWVMAPLWAGESGREGQRKTLPRGAVLLDLSPELILYSLTASLLDTSLKSASEHLFAGKSEKCSWPALTACGSWRLTPGRARPRAGRQSTRLDLSQPSLYSDSSPSPSRSSSDLSYSSTTSSSLRFRPLIIVRKPSSRPSTTHHVLRGCVRSRPRRASSRRRAALSRVKPASRAAKPRVLRFAPPQPLLLLEGEHTLLLLAALAAFAPSRVELPAALL